MPHVELPQAEFKVVMLGDTNAGKTSLVLRFAEGYYRDAPRSSTVGAFFITKRIQTSDGITCKIQIWDTAGQAQFRAMAPMYYKSAAAAIVCYDIANKNSFRVMREWLDELHRNVPAGSIVIAIAAMKSDLAIEVDPSLLVSTSEAEELAGALGAIFVDTSAKTNLNVNVLFQRVAERVLQFRKNAQRAGRRGDKGGIPVTPGASINRKGRVVKNGTPRNLDNGSVDVLSIDVGEADVLANGSKQPLNEGDVRREIPGKEEQLSSEDFVETPESSAPLKMCDAAGPLTCGVFSTSSGRRADGDGSSSSCAIS